MLACQAGRIDLVKSLMKRNAKVTVCSHEVSLCCPNTICQSLAQAQCAYVVQLQFRRTWQALGVCLYRAK